MTTVRVAAAAESGRLQAKEHNRYWEIKTSKSGFLSGKRNLFNRVCWYILTLFMVLPLAFAAWYYRRKLAARPAGDSPAAPFRLFTGVYPGCVYSPLVKSRELELFRAAQIQAPVMEIGIGDGYFSSLLFGGRKQRLDFGADLAFEMLKRSRQYGHCDRYLVMDALEIPLPDNCLGTVIMNNLIHHLPDRDSALRELIRVLKPGGRLIFTDNTLSWGSCTWEQLFLRKLCLGWLADRVMAFKLKLFAQNLLIDEKYYENRSQALGFKVKETTGFVSRRSMYLSSLFEFLNLKQGQPTRQEMRRWLSIFRLDRKVNGYTCEIIEDCLRQESNGEDRVFAFKFFVLEKTGGSVAARTPEYVCPACKNRLERDTKRYRCIPCSVIYPEIDGIPVFLSYREQLKGFSGYLKEKREEDAGPYLT